MITSNETAPENKVEFNNPEEFEKFLGALDPVNDKIYMATPTGSNFHRSDAKLRLMAGPVGCGKTVAASVAEYVRLAEIQKPDLHGVRATRNMTIRASENELKNSVIRTFLDWNRNLGEYKQSSPITFMGKWKMPDGSKVEAEVLFVPIDGVLSIHKMLSMEVTYFFLNELRTLQKCVLDYATQRVGRFPRVIKNAFGDIIFPGATHPCIYADTNAAPKAHWMYEYFFVHKPKNCEVFMYPGAVIETADGYKVNPDAENLSSLPEGYYEDQIPGKSKMYIETFLMNQFTDFVDGAVVFPEYLDAFHYNDTLQPDPAYPLLLGFDFGSNNACVIAQAIPTSCKRYKLHVVDEIFMDKSNIETFLDTQVKPLLNSKYKQYVIEEVIYDPAGASNLGLKNTFADILASRGLRGRPGLSNVIIHRKSAVVFFLSTLFGVNSDLPGLQLSPECVLLREGFLRDYHYRRYKTIGANGEYRTEPDKNTHSHPHDALQYIAMYVAAKCGHLKSTTAPKISFPSSYTNSSPTRRLAL